MIFTSLSFHTTSALVRLIQAIVFTIADESFKNALLSISAQELVSLANLAWFLLS